VIRFIRIAAVLATVGAGLALGTGTASAQPSQLTGTTWDVSFSWTGGNSGTFAITFHANNKAVIRGYNGKLLWYQTADLSSVYFVYSNNKKYSCQAIYDGQLSSTSAMAGYNETDGSSSCYQQGSWTASEASGTSARTASGAPSGLRSSPRGGLATGLKGTTWDVSVSWSGGVSGTFDATLEAHHVLGQDSGVAANWYQDTKYDGIYMIFQESSDYPCQAIYDGQLSSPTAMAGNQETDGNSNCVTQGTWSASAASTSSPARHAMHSMLTTAGVRRSS
jgi:hypothetical protein